MKTHQFICKHFFDLDKSLVELNKVNPNLIFVMASRNWFEKCDLTQIHQKNPNAIVIGCSTAGEISKNGVSDNSLVLSALKFNNPILKTAIHQFENMSDSFNAGKEIAKKFDSARTSSVFILGKGLGINGSKVVEGMQSELNKSTVITGGLAGDGALFEKTYVLLNDQMLTNAVVALAIYDKSVEIFTGSHGGWKPFGPLRKVTKSIENVLYTIDNRTALEVYKEYLGDQASKLPGSGLLFPLEILDNDQQKNGIIRTILSINEEEGSITFAGEIGEGKLCRLMHTKNDGLVTGATEAAEMCLQNTSSKNNDDTFAVLISCVGRKLVMNDEIDDEVDAVKNVLNLKNNITGFYSYGEISPGIDDHVCALHNQTMTISYFKDVG